MRRIKLYLSLGKSHQSITSLKSQPCPPPCPSHQPLQPSSTCLCLPFPWERSAGPYFEFKGLIPRAAMQARNANKEESSYNAGGAGEAQIFKLLLSPLPVHLCVCREPPNALPKQLGQPLSELLQQDSTGAKHAGQSLHAVHFRAGGCNRAMPFTYRAQRRVPDTDPASRIHRRWIR